MNRLGIMIDVSHPSKESMMQTLAITKAPIIASHSSVRALANVSRNLDDEQLLALKKNGGVMQTVAFNSYVKTDSAERVAALNALRKEFGLPDNAPLTAGGGGRGGRADAAGAPATPSNPCAGGRGGRGAQGAGSTTLDTAARGATGATGDTAGRGQGRGGRGNALAALSEEQRASLQAKLEAVNTKLPP